jgi:hypothetical protein
MSAPAAVEASSLYDKLPWQVQPVIHVSAAADAESYAHRVAAPFGVEPAALIAPAGVPDAPTREELAAGMPEADFARLDELGSQLQDMLESLYPPLPDPVSGSYLSVHLAGGGGIEPGTVAFVRVTAGRTVQYLLPHLIVDPATLRPRIIPPPPPPPPPRAARPRTTLAVAPPLVSGGLAVAGTLAWGLPAPWNVAAAGVVTTVEQLINLWPDDDKGPSPLQVAVTEIEKYIDQTEIGKAASQIRGFTTYVQDQQALLKIPIGPSRYVETTLLPKLQQMTTPGGNSVYDAIQQLESMLATVSVGLKKDVLDLLLSGVTLQLLGLQMIVQLNAAAAAAAEDSGDDQAKMELTNLWLADYVNLEQAILGAVGTSGRGWVDRATAAIASYTTARKDQVRKPYRYVLPFNPGGAEIEDGASCQYFGWTFTDDGVPNDDPKTRFISDTWKGDATCCEEHVVQHGDLVDKAYWQYVASVSNEVTGQRTPIVGAWSKAIEEWRQKLPPPAPTAAPKVAALPGGAATPQGSGWVNGNKVQYAIGYVNSAPPAAAPPKTRAGAGPSGAGPSSSWLPIGATAFARLTEFPPDPTRMATHVRIYRRFRTSIGQTTGWQIVTTIPAAQASYDDTDLSHV